MQFNQAKTRYTPDNKTKSENSRPRVSAYTESFKGEFYNISVEKLIPFKNQARKFFDEESILSLSETIKEHGIRQPLTIIPSDIKEGHYEVISGERRLRAAKMAGLKQVPCIIIHDMKKAEEIAIIENIQRQDLHPIELMQAFTSLLNNGICRNHSEIAKKVAMSRTSVVEIMNLGSLATDVQIKLLQSNIIGRDFLRKLSKATEEEQKTLVDNHLNSIIANKKEPAKPRKNILLISYKENDFEILRNNISYLSEVQKQQLKQLLEKLID